MKSILLALSISFALLPLTMFAQDIAPPQPTKQWWHMRYPQQEANPNAKKMPLISVHGNHFVDPQGNTVLFRGMSIADPDKIEGEGHWNKDFFVHVQQTGAHVVRIPVHPIAWRTRTPQGYLALLIRRWNGAPSSACNIDIDWHSIGNLKAGLFQDPMYETSMQETFEFWRIIATHFAGNNTVAFYNCSMNRHHFSTSLVAFPGVTGRRSTKTLSF